MPAGTSARYTNFSLILHFCTAEDRGLQAWSRPSSAVHRLCCDDWKQCSFNLQLVLARILHER